MSNLANRRRLVAETSQDKCKGKSITLI